MSRPTRFTLETRTTILQAFQEGMSIKDACALAGIGESTYHMWMQVGRAVIDGAAHPRKPTGADNQALRNDYAKFLEDAERARASGRVRALSTITTAGRDSWVHTQTGQRLYNPPPPITWTHRETGAHIFQEPDDPSQYTREWSGKCWVFYKGQWQAHAWYLERTDPANWAKQAMLKIEGMERLQAMADKAGVSLEDLFNVMADELDDD